MNKSSFSFGVFVSWRLGGLRVTPTYRARLKVHGSALTAAADYPLRKERV